MPSASGVYTLPPGYLAVTGSTIQASQHNPPFEDVAAALTGRLSRDGSAAMTGAIKLLPGTAAVPGAAFSTDPSSGLFKTTNGIGFSVGGAQVAEITSAGFASGVRMLGELLPWTRVTCPALWVFPFGQTLSRTTFAALWAQAQIEIAAGNLFFNNGDGSITFGIGDLRGRVIAGLDNLGGSAAGRLTTLTFSPDAKTVGAVSSGSAQGETITLTAAQLPTITASGSNSITVLSNQGGVVSGATTGSALTNASGSFFGPASLSPLTVGQITSTGSNTINVTSNNTSGGAHGNVQPTMVLPAIMFAGA